MTAPDVIQIIVGSFTLAGFITGFVLGHLVTKDSMR